MTTGRALKKDGRNLGGQEQKIVRQPMNKLRHRLVIGVDAADGFARLVLQGRERAPFMDRPLGFRIRATAAEQQRHGNAAGGFVEGIHLRCSIGVSLMS